MAGERPSQNGSNGVSSSIHAPTTAQALSYEGKYAAHNYHPLPMVFARAEGATVWDPEVGNI